MSKSRTNWYKYAAPANFYPLAGKLIPLFAVPTVFLFIAGMYLGFFVAPSEAVQGESYRILFIHVPAAWMGLFLYVLMGIYAGLGWALQWGLAAMLVWACAAARAVFTFNAL